MFSVVKLETRVWEPIEKNAREQFVEVECGWPIAVKMVGGGLLNSKVVHNNLKRWLCWLDDCYVALSSCDDSFRIIYCVLVSVACKR